MKTEVTPSYPGGYREKMQLMSTKVKLSKHHFAKKTNTISRVSDPKKWRKSSASRAKQCKILILLQRLNSCRALLDLNVLIVILPIITQPLWVRWPLWLRNLERESVSHLSNAQKKWREDATRRTYILNGKDGKWLLGSMHEQGPGHRLAVVKINKTQVSISLLDDEALMKWNPKSNRPDFAL